MGNISTLASVQHRPVRSGTPVELMHASRRRRSLAALGSIIAAWEERIRFRLKLEQMSKDNPHLIGDIGLTRKQAEAEIAKPFWQA